MPEKSLYYVSAFLFLWWLVALAALTFQTTGAVIGGTAYFASWTAFFFSGLILYNEHTQFRSVVDTVVHLEAGGPSTFYMFVPSASC